MSENTEFKIQPHPPFPGSDAEATPGLGSAPNLAHLHDNPLGGRGNNPHVTEAKLEQPKSRDELKSLQAQLNDNSGAEQSRPGSSMEGSAGEL